VVEDVSYIALWRFYGEILSHMKPGIFPQEIRSKNLRDTYLGNDPYEGFFDVIFTSMDWIVNNDIDAVSVCASDDIEDGGVCGDYIYWASSLSPDLAFIYMEATHPWHYPHRAILYDPKMRINIAGSNSSILVTEGSERYIERFRIPDEDRRIASIKELLQEFDRPRLIDVYEKGDSW